MNNLLNYLLEVNLVLVVLAALYYLLLRKENDFRFKRYLLVGGVVIALMAPALNITSFNFEALPSSQDIGTILLPELHVGDANSPVSSTPSFFNFELLYWLGSIIVAQLFVFHVLQIIWFVRSSKVNVKKSNGIIYIRTNGTLPTFTFLNLLFIDNSVEMTPDERSQIIAHEKEHIRQLHSLDIILFELTKILCWFNPVVWLLKKEITDLHEYLADEKIIKTTDAQQYSSLLASMALNQAQLAIGHHFNKSKTIKRINMMKTKKRNVQGWKTAIIIPAFAFITFMVSCNDEVMQDVNEVMATATQMEVPETFQQEYAEMQKKYPSADLIYMEVDGASKEAIANLDDIDVNTIAWVNIDKNKERISLFVNKNGPLSNYANADAGKDVFTIVDEPAQVKMGMEPFYHAIAENLTYPAEARKAGIEGRVYVQFIVNESGTMEDLKVVKGIGGGCDEAAVAALKVVNPEFSEPKQQGKVVKQKMVLPINFNLNNSEGKNESNSGSEIKVNGYTN